MPGVDFVVVDPRDPAAREALGEYLTEVAERIAEPAVNMSELDDVGDFVMPSGAFLVIVDGQNPIGCGGVRTIAPAIGEIKRMWVRRERRGEGLGKELLGALEAASWNLGHRVLRLDTNHSLVEAIRLYESRGYRTIARYNDNPDATQFYEKRLRGSI